MFLPNFLQIRVFLASMKFRFYPNLIEAITKSLYSIHTENNHANQVVAELLKSNKKWGSKDRRFLAESIYEINRYFRIYQYAANVEEPVEKNDYWKLFAAFALEKNKKLPEWDEFADINATEIDKRLNDGKKEFTLRESIPDWLDDLGRTALTPKIWEKEIEEQNKEAEVVLRINPLAIPKKAASAPVEFVQSGLQKEGILTEWLEEYPLALQLKEKKNILHTKVYQNGYIEIQDASSQLVVPFSGVKPGMIVVDTCAGAGGKTLHLASLMNNQGQIYSLEPIQWKLNELEKRAKRSKAEIIETGLPDVSFLTDFEQSADIVLIDAPCSGLGTLKRKPDLKWKLSQQFIDEQIALQASILQQYANLVKPGKHLIYSTCSILPQENQLQIEQFLKTGIGSEFRLEEDKQIFAHENGYDGFYMASLIRSE